MNKAEVNKLFDFAQQELETLEKTFNMLLEESNNKLSGDGGCLHYFFTFKRTPASDDIKISLAISFLCICVTKRAINDKEILHILKALLNTASCISWAKGHIESAAQRSKTMSHFAKIAHIDTYQKRHEIIEYWKENIPVEKSSEFAAELLNKHFQGISHRTLVKYISEAKKELKLQSGSQP